MSIIDFAHDVGREPVCRILNEKAVVSIPEYHVVGDIDPIVQSHHLVLPLADIASFADHYDGSTDLGLLRSPPAENIAQMLGFKDWIWLERGRAKFCTSLMTSSHAHAHLLDASELSHDCTHRLSQQLKVSTHKTLQAAIKRLSRIEGEYLLFGGSNTDWHIALPPNSCFSQKRFIRNYLTSNRR